MEELTFVGCSEMGFEQKFVWRKQRNLPFWVEQKNGLLSRSLFRRKQEPWALKTRHHAYHAYSVTLVLIQVLANLKTLKRDGM
jgi:hypothetical protein